MTSKYLHECFGIRSFCRAWHLRRFGSVHFMCGHRPLVLAIGPNKDRRVPVCICAIWWSARR